MLIYQFPTPGTGIELILAYSWARPATLAAGGWRGGGGRGDFFFTSSVSSFSLIFLLVPCPSLSSPILSLLSLFCLSLGDDIKWPQGLTCRQTPEQSINPPPGAGTAGFYHHLTIHELGVRVFRVKEIQLWIITFNARFLSCSSRPHQETKKIHYSLSMTQINGVRILNTSLDRIIQKGFLECEPQRLRLAC